MGWFSEERGSGFISPDDSGQNLFTHYSEISEIEGSGGFRRSRRASV
jgi:cold shock CspA family protein